MSCPTAVSLVNRSSISLSPAPKIIGGANKKLKRAAVERGSPRSIPVAIVLPEREIPGKIATAWASPIDQRVAGV